MAVYIATSEEIDKMIAAHKEYCTGTGRFHDLGNWETIEAYIAELREASLIPSPAPGKSHAT